MSNDFENMRRREQAGILIAGGLLGVLGVVAGIQEKDYTQIASCGLGCIAAFALAIWRLRHLAKDSDSN
jgi:heme A synthase